MTRLLVLLIGLVIGACAGAGGLAALAYWYTERSGR